VSGLSGFTRSASVDFERVPAQAQRKILFENLPFLRKTIFMGKFVLFQIEQVWHNHLRNHFCDQSPLGCHL
jgi:hypothetical protein